MKTYFLTFTEEFWNGQDQRYTMGRLEIYKNDNPFAVNEIRFLTKKESFKKFRELVDFKEYNSIQVWLIKFITKLLYYENHN